MVNLIKAKNCETITPVKVPTNLLSPASKKRKEQIVENNPCNKQTEMAQEVDTHKKKGKISKPLNHADLMVFFEQQLKDAGHPGLNRICRFVGLTQDQILPTLKKKTCRTYLIMRKCMWDKQCKFDHLTATKEEVDHIITIKLK